ncbi:MAG: PorT family protein [Flavobacteriales bacterium]|nr:PorT family protein [Flavobacteriales bacterium]
MVGVLCFCWSTLSAQVNEGPLFKAYFGAGVTSSQISGDRLNGFDQLGFNLGLGTELQRNAQWRPRLEIIFNQLGSRKNARPDEGDFDSYLLRLNYIQVPLTMSYLSGSTGFELGLAPGYLLSSREEDENGTVLGLGREFKDYDLGLILGIRYAFAERWELGTRLYQSTLAVRDHTGSSTFRLNRGQYSTAIQFILRYSVSG